MRNIGVGASMTSSAPNSARTSSGMQQMARRPRDSDGVGNALRQTFGSCSALPAEFQSLLARLPRDG
jgi:hypothetical protein